MLKIERGFVSSHHKRKKQKPQRGKKANPPNDRSKEAKIYDIEDGIDDPCYNVCDGKTVHPVHISILDCELGAGAVSRTAYWPSFKKSSPLPSDNKPAWEYTPSLARVSVMSKLRMVSWPMRSSGLNGASSTFSMLRRSGA